jgi:hypothetical protein
MSLDQKKIPHKALRFKQADQKRGHSLIKSNKNIKEKCTGKKMKVKNKYRETEKQQRGSQQNTGKKNNKKEHTGRMTAT